LFYRVQVDPGEGTNCLWFQAFFASANDPSGTTPTGASLRDTCATALGTQEAELVVEDNGAITINVPRALYPTFTDGSVLKTPKAHVRNFIGGAVTAPVIDTTKAGTDYTIAGTTTEEPPKDEPKKPKKPKKHKKKKKEKGGDEAPAACAPYVPGEQGADAETVVVTDAATEDAPIEVVIEQGPGLVTGTVARSHAFRNIQVDSAAVDAGLYVRYEFPAYEDHDLYLNYADGSVAAQAAGFNPIVEAPLVNDGTSIGGHSERGAEQIDGVRTADCDGYTADFDAFLARGGEYTVTLWLGEAANDPQAPGGARAMFAAVHTAMKSVAAQFRI
jgi:hypothetical protein